MANTSIKNVTTEAVEAAIAQALATLTGWDSCSVEIQKMEFVNPMQLSTGESVSITLKARFSETDQGFQTIVG